MFSARVRSGLSSVIGRRSESRSVGRKYTTAGLGKRHELQSGTKLWVARARPSTFHVSTEPFISRVGRGPCSGLSRLSSQSDAGEGERQRPLCRVLGWTSGCICMEQATSNIGRVHVGNGNVSKWRWQMQRVLAMAGRWIGEQRREGG